MSASRPDDDEAPCCDAPLIWVAGEAHDRSCHARLERCATCEGHRVVCWWHPRPRGWGGAMAVRSAEVSEQAVLAAYTPAPDLSESGQA